MHKVMQITYRDPIWTQRSRASCGKAASQGVVEKFFLELHISMVKSKYHLLLERKPFLALVEKNDLKTSYHPELQREPASFRTLLFSTQSHT